MVRRPRQPRQVTRAGTNAGRSRVRRRGFGFGGRAGHDAHVIKHDGGVFDTFPLSLITTQAIASLGALGGAELDVQRFRPNILVEASNDEEFPEDLWIGGVLRIGGAEMRIDKRDKRCAVVNVDPESTRTDPAVLRMITQAREACVGVYGSTVQPGRVAVGDQVYLS